MRIKWGVILILVVLLQSCTVLKEYEKVYVNDEEMLLVSRSLERFESNFQVYREAAAGGNGGKTGGGCGCN
ncbi:MAG: hypothetical protein RLZZ593_695 [Bacteroidota bacterium]|jgi:hypothetical protein